MFAGNKKVEAIAEFFRLPQQYVTKQKTAKNSAETFIYILCWHYFFDLIKLYSLLITHLN